jgi:hypothetical protein
MNLSDRSAAVLRIIAFLGLAGPNAVFLYYAGTDFSRLITLSLHPFTLAWILDACIAMGVLAYFFAQRPLGRFDWKTFVLLSLAGGLAFSLPAFLLINRKIEESENPI